MPAKTLAKPARKPRRAPRPADSEPRFSAEFLRLNSARCTLHIMADRLRRIAMLRADEITGTALLRGMTTAAALDHIADHAAPTIIPGWPVLETFIDGALADLLK